MMIDKYEEVDPRLSSMIAEAVDGGEPIESLLFLQHHDPTIGFVRLDSSKFASTMKDAKAGHCILVKSVGGTNAAPTMNFTYVLRTPVGQGAG